jgi:hypothetical protein
MVTTVTFERRTGNADNGKIIIVTTNDGLTSTIEGAEAVNIRIRVTAPTGIIYDTITSGSADATGLAVAAALTKKVTIPVTSNSDVMGTYIVEIKVEITANTADNTTLTGEYEYCPEDKSSVRFAGNCQGPSLQLFDKSTYLGYTLLSRVLTLVHPEIEGTQLPNTTTGNSQIIIAPTHSNVVYQGSITTTVQKSLEVEVLEGYDDVFTFYYNATWTTTSNYTFKCATNLNDIANCYIEKMTTLEAKACRVGGYKALSKQEFDLMIAMQNIWVLYTLAQSCGDYDKMETYHTQLKALLNCDCCGSSSASTIEPIVGSTYAAPPDSVWTDIEDDDLINDWTKSSGLIGGVFLKWKIVNGVFYMKGAIINTAATVSKLAKPFLNMSFLTSLGVDVTEFFHSIAVQEITAGTDAYPIGWVFVSGGYMILQVNPDYEPTQPIRLNVVMPLD